jgi:hypothetical protein
MMSSKDTNYKEFNIKDFDIDIQEMYNENVEHGYEEIVKSLLTTVEGAVDLKERKRPQYAIGSLDEDGYPTQEKIKDMMKRILLGTAWINVFEGGVRGGKDVWGIYFYTEYLMYCTEKMHLVTGVSLEHALLTVLQSNGFGLLYTIPQGKFLRSSVDGAQRGVYKFLDAWGIEKEIHFYGNYKQDDHKKFQGFTFGSVYINEGTNQHLNGINEAVQRTSASNEKLILITQNPKGSANRFYTEFEKPFLLTASEIKFIEELKNNDYVISKYNSYKEKIISEKKKAEKHLIKTYCQQKNRPSYKHLDEQDQIFIQKKIYDTRIHYEKLLSKTFLHKFIPLEEDDKFYNMSLHKLLMYEKGGNNPNKISNGYDYNYFHFTVDDNLAMDDMQRADFKSKYAKGSSTYAQRVEGIRRTTDGAVYSMFTNKNIFDGDIERFDCSDTRRVIAVDKGLSHPSGIIDCEIDYFNGIVWQLGEKLLEFKDKKIENKGLETIYQSILEVIRRRKNRVMPDFILVDPSSPELISYLRDKGLPVREAVNDVWSLKGKRETTHKAQDKDLIGIELVQTAIAKLKYRVHESCIETISQIESYEAPFDEKSGKDKVIKVNDDLVDPIRYIFNTLIRIGMWEGDKTDGNEQEIEPRKLSGNEGSEDSQRDLAREFASAIFEEATGQPTTETTDFWGYDDGFFGGF